MSEPRILIVEDELLVAADLEERLRALGYCVVGSTAHGEKAVGLADQLRPDLILMDIHLAGPMDGISAAEQIRREGGEPVVFLTAYSEDSTLQRAKLTEPYGYILKPFEDRELKSTLEIALYKHQAEANIRRLQRLYAVLSQVNQAIVRCPSRQELFPAIARVAIEFGQFKVARIDLCAAGRQTFTPLERAGEEYPPPHLLPPASAEVVSGPGAALRRACGGETGLCNDVLMESAAAADREQALRLGIRSFAAVPFYCQGALQGVLSLAAGEPGFFREAELKLLDEMALDISFALDHFEETARRERAEASVRASERKYRTLAEQLPDLVWQKDRQGVYVSCNNLYAQAVGLETAAVVGHRDPDFYPPELVAKYQADDARVIATGQPFEVEELGQHQGRARWFQTRKAPVLDEHGQCIGTIGIARDITARKQAEEALRGSEARYRSLFDNMLNGLAYCRMVFDQDEPRDWIYLAVNDMFETLTGLRNVVGRKVSEVIPGLPQTDPELLAIYGRVARTGRPEKFEMHVAALKMWFSVSAYSPSLDHFVSVFDVITERKQAEAKLQEQLAELSRWHQASLGREDRILELKREVNDLLAQAGQPARYASALEAPTSDQRDPNDQSPTPPGGRSGP